MSRVSKAAVSQSQVAPTDRADPAKAGGGATSVRAGSTTAPVAELVPGCAVERNGRRLLRADPTRLSPELEAFRTNLKAQVIGQPDYCDALVRIIIRARAGILRSRGPVGKIAVAGPTGVGKTRGVEVATRLLSGKRDHFIKLSGGNYQESYSVANLVGAPIGYRGDGETKPVITQETIDALRCSDEVPVTFILLDELEKSHETFRRFWLEAMDTGKAKVRAPVEDEAKSAGARESDSSKSEEVTLDFSRCVFVCTTNAAAELFDTACTQKPIGFTAPLVARTSEVPPTVSLDEVKAALRQHFAPEFLGRLDDLVVARPLSGTDVRKILDLELADLWGMLNQSTKVHGVQYRATPTAKELLLSEGFDARYGGRNLANSLQRLLAAPLAAAMESGQLTSSSRVIITGDDGLGFLVRDKPVRFTDAVEAYIKIDALSDAMLEAQTEKDFPKRLEAAAAEVESLAAGMRPGSAASTFLGLGIATLRATSAQGAHPICASGALLALREVKRLQGAPREAETFAALAALVRGMVNSLHGWIGEDGAIQSAAALEEARHVPMGLCEVLEKSTNVAGAAEVAAYLRSADGLAAKRSGEETGWPEFLRRAAALELAAGRLGACKSDASLSRALATALATLNADAPQVHGELARARWAVREAAT